MSRNENFHTAGNVYECAQKQGKAKKFDKIPYIYSIVNKRKRTDNSTIGSGYAVFLFLNGGAATCKPQPRNGISSPADCKGVKNRVIKPTKSVDREKTKSGMPSNSVCPAIKRQLRKTCTARRPENPRQAESAVYRHQAARLCLKDCFIGKDSCRKSKNNIISRQVFRKKRIFGIFAKSTYPGAERSRETAGIKPSARIKKS
ncbi:MULTISPECIES: hypothetical protein [unclassified Treponema]|uniref:hypothetical protein n=1 Tax=unclassified Treponema TaxID=2638727 RepID=UPI0020A4C36F|nr:MULTISPECIES: hypothetical protein [unclassified Treponema]UTC66720.1 hypothetical protein E4O06_12290 [Treponema sp. OMZ 789]UTC69452.1 hypothetical protein E4O01_12430 [Treponema sp. OMZ 790]UTC72166.1 hypothetical protein E4O02_12525 [Treponema sp. OMZ 791]